MAVYCDVCCEVGNANDEAGYTEGGGWLCPKHRQTTIKPFVSIKETLQDVAALIKSAQSAEQHGRYSTLRRKTTLARDKLNTIL